MHKDDPKLRVNTDSTEIKARHLETKYLQVQEKMRDRTISALEVRTELNWEDFLKPLDGERFWMLLSCLPFRTPNSGRILVFGIRQAATVVAAQEESTTTMTAWWTPMVWTFGLALMSAMLTGVMTHSKSTKWRPRRRSSKSRHTQTDDQEPYWEWSATKLRALCEELGIYRGQLKSQMIKDLIGVR